MKTKIHASSLFWVVVCILISCASSKTHFDLASATSKPGINMYNARLGIMPLDSYPTYFGRTISQIIGKHLKNTQIEVTETAELNKILQDHNIDFREVTRNSDYRMIGEVCNIDYLLIGVVVVSTLSKQFVRPGGIVFVDFKKTNLQIIDTITGKVVLSANVERPRQKKWHRADIIGEALAEAVRKELTGDK